MQGVGFGLQGAGLRIYEGRKIGVVGTVNGLRF